MSCRTTTEIRAAREVELAELIQQLSDINTAISKAGTGVDSYKFESGDGSQSVKYTSIKDLFLIKRNLQLQINHLNHVICGTTAVSVTLRRRGRCY